MKLLMTLWLAAAAAAIFLGAFARAGEAPTGRDAAVAITVFGQVKNQGIIHVVDASLIRVLAMSGGWTRLADQKKIALLRRKQDGDIELIVIDAAALLNGSKEDFRLQHGDVIYVPERVL